MTIKLDGRSSDLELRPDDVGVLEAALRVRSDLPFACRGGVCGTCRAQLVEGTVAMDVNYALEPEEIARRLRPHLPVAPDVGARRPRLRRLSEDVPSRRSRHGTAAANAAASSLAKASALALAVALGQLLRRPSPGPWAGA